MPCVRCECGDGRSAEAVHVPPVLRSRPMRDGLKAVLRRIMPHSIYRRYRRRKIASIIAGYTPREVTHSYGGHRLRIRLEDPLAEAWYDRDWQEPEMITFLRERNALGAGSTVFDLGAHQAVLALIIARATGETGRVLAIEAEPHNARVATANCELNNAGNVSVIHAAAAATEGFTTFAEGLTGQVDERTASGNVTVAAVSIDGLAERYGTPDVVFIDVEGYEEQALKGASRTLANGSTSFLVEVHDAETLGTFEATSEAVVAYFQDFDKYLAVEDDDPFLEMNGSPPSGRFFLAAIPAKAR
jgi:FkbM family methyltransferase